MSSIQPGRPAITVLTDSQWAALAPLIEACRPHAKVPPADLRRTVEAILWRCTNGEKWRAVPPELGPWWRAAQIFIRWTRLGVWDELLELARRNGVEPGAAAVLASVGGRGQPRPGAAKKKHLGRAVSQVRHLGTLVATMAPPRA